MVARPAPCLVLLALALAVCACAGCVVVRDVAHTGQSLKIEAHGPDALRVRAVPTSGGHAFRDDLVSALVPPPPLAMTSSAMKPCIDSNDVTVVAAPPYNVSNGNLRAEVDASGLLSFYRASDDALLLSESTARSFQPAGGGLDGFLSLDLAFRPSDGERIYGLGQHKTGSLNNKGAGPLSLRPRNTEILVPVVHSSIGYAFLFNLPSFGTVELNDTGSFWTADVVLQADFWVATTTSANDDSPPHDDTDAAGRGSGGSPWAQLQRSYADATGHAPVYPYWTTGYWQSKNRYHNQSQLLDVADGYLSRGLPLSLMIIDYYSWSPGHLGDETLPAECWPDPKGMVAQLKSRGVETMISPYFHSLTEQSRPFDEANDTGLLARNATTGLPARVGYAGAYLYDVFRAEARRYAYERVRRGYVEWYGLRHWWLDCDEPCGDDARIAELMYNNGTWSAAFVGAAYPHLVHQMVWEGARAEAAASGGLYNTNEGDGDGGDVSVMLSRSAWAGSQRFGAAVWSGDVGSTFDSLRQQFRAGLNVMMSGLPYWTTDVGGYAGGNVDDPDFRELVVRWFQWGAFCPIFRSHGRRSGGPSQEGGDPKCGATNGPNEVWHFGERAEKAIGRVMKLREQLRPYVHELYKESSESGTPPMRPLFYDFWTQLRSADVDDEYMFGPSYLVAPQMYQGATNRTVWLPSLPAGEVWRNVFSGVVTDTSKTADGATIVEPTPLEGDGFGTFPLYQRVPAVSNDELRDASVY